MKTNKDKTRDVEQSKQIPFEDTLSSSSIKKLCDKFVAMAEGEGYAVTECFVRCASKGSGFDPAYGAHDGSIRLEIHRVLPYDPEERS